MSGAPPSHSQVITMATEPTARQFHAALAIGQNMFICAGSGHGIESSVLHKFDVASTSWQEPRRLLKQTFPDCFYGMAVASDGENSYLFGGFVGIEGTCNKIYEINISLECRELVPATPVGPTGRGHSGLICTNRTLISYGGYTGRSDLALNDLFLFDLNTSERVLLLPYNHNYFTRSVSGVRIQGSFSYTIATPHTTLTDL